MPSGWRHRLAREARTSNGVQSDAGDDTPALALPRRRGEGEFQDGSAAAERFPELDVGLHGDAVMRVLQAIAHGLDMVRDVDLVLAGREQLGRKLEACRIDLAGEAARARARARRRAAVPDGARRRALQRQPAGPGGHAQRQARAVDDRRDGARPAAGGPRGGAAPRHRREPQPPPALAAHAQAVG